MSGIVDKLFNYVSKANDVYQENIGQPFVRGLGMLQQGQQTASQALTDAAQGYLGLRPDEVSQSYKVGEAVGNMPGTGAPAGMFKAGVKGLEAVGLGIMAGAGAKLAPKAAMQTAEEMFKAGFNPRDVYKATGMYTREGIPVMFEISDTASKWKNLDQMNKLVDSFPKEGISAKVGDMFDHKQLFENYPELANYGLKIIDKDPKSSWSGSFNPATQEIILRRSDPLKMRQTLIHELDHAVAHKELFPSGGSAETMTTGRAAMIGAAEASNKIKFYKGQLNDARNVGMAKETVEALKSSIRQAEYKKKYYDQLSKYPSTPEGRRQAYMDLFGEVMARNAENRLYLTEKERAAKFIEDTMDIPTQGEFLFSSPKGVNEAYDHPAALTRKPK